MNPFCPNCGARLVQNQVKDWWICPTCDETRTGQEVYETPNQLLMHGTKCRSCDGEGTIEVETQQGHPYGDTVAIETLTETEDCEECMCRGAHMDKDSCIICGEVVNNGWAKKGWEVHPECHQEETPKKGIWS